jgi:arsenite/tail-anchored protein-transporting ATPase
VVSKTRVLIFTGKGGVGKTSTAAATALDCARRGYKTIAISTDPAHSLSDSVEAKSKSPELMKIAPNLDIKEINIIVELEKYWQSVQSYLVSLLSSQGFSDMVAEELAVLPGFEELSSLLYVEEYDQNHEYDVIVLDCAPTAETLRLLSLPEVAKWYMNKLFRVERKIMKVVRPVAKGLLPIPLPNDETLDQIQELYERIARVKEILEDSSRTSIRLVMNPEKMVVKEAQRAYTYLNLFSYAVDAIIVNKVIPEDVKDPYFREWKKIQKRHLEEIHDSFSPLSIFNVQLFENEVVGLKMLEQMGTQIYGGRDPTEIFYEEKPFVMSKKGGVYTVSMKLPFVGKEDVDLLNKAGELIVKVGNYKRVVMLPTTLSGLEPKSAEFVEDRLEIRFEKEVIKTGKD